MGLKEGRNSGLLVLLHMMQYVRADQPQSTFLEPQESAIQGRKLDSFAHRFVLMLDRYQSAWFLLSVRRQGLACSSRSSMAGEQG